MNERSALITLGGEEFELLFSTKAAKEIDKRYGGLENLGKALEGAEGFTQRSDELMWLTALLANQSIIIYNKRNPKKEKKSLVTEDYLEAITSPVDYADINMAIIEAIKKGTQRNIVSEENAKNTETE